LSLNKKRTISVVLRKSLRVFENRVMRRIFGTERDEVMGGWRKLRELSNSFSLPNIIRVIELRRMG
jgi:hypothetical protein